jgi:hypothetical protein
VRKILISAAVLLMCACGCSRVHQVDPTADSGSLDKLNGSFRGKVVTIELRDGREAVGDGVHVGSDTTFWYAPPSVTDRTSVATSDVKRIRFREPLREAARWGKLGLVGGAVVGALSGALAAASVESKAKYTPVVVGGSIVGAAAVGAAAALTAFLISPEEIFEFR